MEYRFLIFIPLLVSFIPSSHTLYPLPSYVPRCNISDTENFDECIANASRSSMEYLCQKGDKKFHIPPLSPCFKFEERCVLANIPGQLQFEFYPYFEVCNLCDMEINNVTLGENFGAITSFTTGCMWFKGIYVIDGWINGTRVSGQNQGCLNFQNATTVLIPRAEIREEAGSSLQYIDIQGYNVTFNANCTTYNLDHLDQPKHDGNDFLDDHQAEIYEIIQPGVEECIAKIFTRIGRTYMSKLSLAEMFDQ